MIPPQFWWLNILLLYLADNETKDWFFKGQQPKHGWRNVEWNTAKVAWRLVAAATAPISHPQALGRAHTEVTYLVEATWNEGSVGTNNLPKSQTLRQPTPYTVGNEK
ncbi:predicted protein [Histoplasma capsulatum G186AR]|uniref:Uncharacterized protein n=1 Tax=Ajellomyces capsulatus (strain G186AR / H82 / ATCC MYA-2454 / RMSCC 2432) TaxID=447093 RepID=C0NJS2_AJECG|nr:uncharacterized protein HCBG_03402 [Histoplasma capsulatum G186AR]EEH08113.1 predicted protein [Histoplasma capsulatum G186AR]